MKVATVCSVYGAYDPPRIQRPQTIEYEQVFVSDHDGGAGRRTVLEYRPHMHPRLAAKVAKCLPWEYTDADIVVWIDGSVEALTDTWLEFLVNSSEGHPISQFQHPFRQSIVDEWQASVPMEKYVGQPVKEQVDHYISKGQPHDWGLWATGLIVYRPHLAREQLADFGTKWLAEQTRWTYQDQLSEPYVLRTCGLRPHILEGYFTQSYLHGHVHGG